MDEEEYVMIRDGFTNIDESLKKIAEGLHYFIEGREKEIARIEKVAQETWDYQKSQKCLVQPKIVQCIFCEAQSHHIMRGNVIYGCVSCVSNAIAEAEL
jgi:aerobic-type carbon monoxide dehydrogenase small subunit (CoxS/CutS family)